MEEKKEVSVEEKKEEISKKSRIINLVFTIVQVVLILICVVASVLIIANPGGYKEDPKDCNTNFMVVMTDSMEPTIKTKDIIFGSKVPKDKVLDLGTVVTFPVKLKNGYILDTHRIVGYQVKTSSDKDEKFYYVKGEFETYEDYLELKGDSEWEFKGYVTRGDKYTLEFGASLDDARIYDDENKLVTNKDDSGYLTVDQILAIWSGKRLGGVGAVISFLQKPLAFALVILLPLVLLFAYNIFIVVKMIIADKSQKARLQAIKEMQENQLDEEEIKRKAIEEYLAKMNEKKEE